MTPTARELMTQHVFTVAAEEPIFEAAGKLLRERFSGAPVLEADGAVVGVLSEQDLVRALIGVESNLQPQGLVRDWMTPTPVTVPPSATVYELARFFRDHSIRRVPVVEGGVLLGLVARREVVRELHHLALLARRDAADRLSPPPRT